jgi:hypothetical protein
LLSDCPIFNPKTPNMFRMRSAQSASQCSSTEPRHFSSQKKFTTTELDVSVGYCGAHLLSLSLSHTISN